MYVKGVLLQSTMMHTQHGWVLCCPPSLLWADSTGSIREEEHFPVPGGRLGEIRRAQTGYQELTSTGLGGCHCWEPPTSEGRGATPQQTQAEPLDTGGPGQTQNPNQPAPGSLLQPCFQPCYPKPAGCPRSRQNPPQSCKAVDSQASGCRDLAGL